MRMQHVAAPALALLATAAWAQEEAVPVSVEGTVVEVPSDIAAAACGLDDDQLEAALQGAGEVGTADDTSAGAGDDVASAGAVAGGAPLCEISRAEATAQGIEAP